MKHLLPWLASFRLRILFRTAFAVLIFAVIALVASVLRGEKQRAWDNYQSGLTKTQEQIVARLRHPSGQLALMNPDRQTGTNAIHPVLLPFSAIDFDDRSKAQNAAEMADCLTRYPRQGSLCVGIGNNPWIGGFIYVVGSLVSGPLAGHAIGDQYLDGSHRMLVSVRLRGKQYRWIAPFEVLPPKRGAAPDGLTGRLTGYTELDGRDYDKQMPIREFRGWLWQESRCIDSHVDDREDCARKSYFSLRLPVEDLIADLLKNRRAPWPPPDLNGIDVDLHFMPPGEGKDRSAALFDSASTEAIAPFSLRDLQNILQAGESLSIQRGDDEVARIRGKIGADEQISPLMTRFIQRLPVVGEARDDSQPIQLVDTVTTPVGDYRIVLYGDVSRVVNLSLSAAATGLAQFAVSVMLIIGAMWIVMEMSMMKRIARMASRARQFSQHELPAAASDFSDLESDDELGILARRLDWLLARVREDASRERIRAAQEKEQWHAVGHEIMSPLQSLLALNGSPDNPNYRYLARMRQAVRVLYGSASPSEAFQSSAVELERLDINRFLSDIAANAPHIGVADVQFSHLGQSVWVYASEYALEDVIGHLLKNADRHRLPSTPITLWLEPHPETDKATIRVHNTGLPIEPAWQEKIFEYGATDSTHKEGEEGRRGQGLFVAKTYVAKMGGTIHVENRDDGVSFYLTLNMDSQ
ncbi:MAG: HAMP domain-containing histidine kinase [Azoarcus sp.]|jgi:signal transduction histidine kinase|nr:HAMP domain-containing histidine kinase [Azoarcus sp.]